MRNFTDAQNALITATNSENSAMEENSRYMESIQAKLNNLNAEYQKFVLGKGGLEDFIKQLLDVATTVMKVINYIGGLKTVIMALSTVLAVGLIGKLKNVINGFKSFNDILKTVKATMTATATTAQLLQSAVAIIGILATGYVALNAELEENLRLLEETLQKNQERYHQIQSDIEILQDENASREDLANIISSVIQGYNAEGKTLDELNKKRQEAIDLLNEEAEAVSLDTLEAGYAQYRKDLNTLSGAESFRGLGQFSDKDLEGQINQLKEYRKFVEDLGGHSTQTVELLNVAISSLEEKYDRVKARTQSYEEALKALNYTYDEQTRTIRPLTEEEIQFNQMVEEGKRVLEEYKDIPYEARVALEAQKDTQDDVINSLDELSEMTGLSQEQINSYISTLEEDAYNEFISSTNVAYQMLMDYKEQLVDTDKQLKEYQNAISETVSVLKDAESAYSIVDKALSEFNSMGGISVETIQNLASLGDEWVQVLYDSIEAGEISQKTLDKLSQSNRNLAIAELQAQASEDMMKIAIGEVNTLSPIAQTALSELAEANKEEAETATDATNAEILHALAIDAVNTALGQGGNVQHAIDQIETVENKYQELIKNMEGWTLGGGTSSKSGKSSKGSSSEKDAYLEAFKKEKEALKHQLEMDYISEKEYYDSLSELVERYFGVATGLHEKYLDTYQENEEEIYKGLKSIYDEVKDYLAEAVEKSYEDAIKVIEKEEEKVLGTIQKQIDDLKDRKDAHLKSVEKEINALKDQKKTVEDYWDAEIDKIKEANKELEQQNQLLELQKKLAEAKSQKVMVMGEEGTFGLAENEKAVSSAEFNLRKYEDELSYEQQLADMEAMRDAQLQNLQGRIDDLQNYYDYLSEYYENQINALEDYYDKTKEVYQGQIDALQEQLDAFKAGQEEYDNIQNAKLASQVMAMDAEAENWNKELANLRNYINQYNSMLTQLGTAGKYVDYSYSAEDGVIPIPTPIGGGVPKHAKGIASVANDEVALVGDSPNRELVLGANVNKLGTLMALSKGSGVVNAESTDTLAGVLNSLVSPTASGSGSNVTQTFSFGNISLPNVTDANSFVKELSDKFNNYAIQFSSIRE